MTRPCQPLVTLAFPPSVPSSTLAFSTVQLVDPTTTSARMVDDPTTDRLHLPLNVAGVSCLSPEQRQECNQHAASIARARLWVRDADIQLSIGGRGACIHRFPCGSSRVCRLNRAFSHFQRLP